MKKSYRLFAILLGYAALNSSTLWAAADQQELDKPSFVSQAVVKRESPEGIYYHCPGHPNPSTGPRRRDFYNNLIRCPGPLGCSGKIIKREDIPETKEQK
jgi:hypothetical protein